MEQPTWIGRSLNERYKIDALLGTGGMSAVYKAYDPNLKRNVAVKLIHPHLATDHDFIYRFKKEAAAVAALHHPNIVQVYDFNVDNEVYYMVLEYISGETLQDHLKHLKNSNAQFSIEPAIQIILNICDALGYAHKQGIIHRDIKPANIMLDAQGQAILMDFGIVKILNATSHTATGAVVGTARYMSPEVIRSEVPDERSDIYSLGITFYEMLSGDPPFNADSAMSLLMRHLNDPVPNLNSVRPDAPPELIRIINKSLEKDRRNRYRSADEMAGDLRRLHATLKTTFASKAEPSAQIDAVAMDNDTVVEETSDHVNEATEPWSISKPALPLDDSISDEPTKVDEPEESSKTEINFTSVKEETRARPGQESAESKPGKAFKSEPRTLTSTLIKWSGAGVVGIILLLGGWFAFRNMAAFAPAPTPTATPTFHPPTSTAVAVHSDTPASTTTEEPTATLEPTPTNTLPPLYVRINDITLNESNYYVVDYETFGYTEQLPGQHVHFFFDTVPVEEAGYPGSGPWKLYGGPRPFTGYGVSDRPAAATQLCALVANPDHSIIPGSGNCFDLPE